MSLETSSKEKSEKLVNSSPICLNLGCGSICPQGWINVDGSFNAVSQKIPLLKSFTSKVLNRKVYDSRNIRYANLNKRWRFASCSIDVVYSSHVLEHLSISSAALFLDEAFRVLKPGGKVRIVVPDLYEIARSYVSNYESGNPDSDFVLLEKLNLHKENVYLPSESFAKKMLNNLQGHPHQHKYMYSERSLERALEQRGFVNIQNSLSYGHSLLIENIRDVEYSNEYEASIYIEAEKSDS